MIRAAALKGFDLLVTNDQNIRQQQNLICPIYELPTVNRLLLKGQLEEVVRELKALSTERADIDDIDIDG